MRAQIAMMLRAVKVAARELMQGKYRQGSVALQAQLLVGPRRRTATIVADEILSARRIVRLRGNSRIAKSGPVPAPRVGTLLRRSLKLKPASEREECCCHKIEALIGGGLHSR
jgi:hypothetical protein